MGYGAVPHLLPAPLGEAEPPEVTRKSRFRVRMLHRNQAVAWPGLAWPLQGAHPSFCFHPDTVALEGGWDSSLFQNLP